MVAEDGFPAHFSKAIWSFHALLLLRHCLSLLPSSICHSLPPIFASLSSIHPWTIPHRASRHRQRSLSSATASLIFSIQFSLPFIFPLHHCFIHLAFIHPPDATSGLFPRHCFTGTSTNDGKRSHRGQSHLYLPHQPCHASTSKLNSPPSTKTELILPQQRLHHCVLNAKQNYKKISPLTFKNEEVGTGLYSSLEFLFI